MPDDEERGEPETPQTTAPPAPATTNAALGSRYHQMFPVLSPAEIDRARPFGEIRHFAAGEFVFRAGETTPGTLVILSGRLAIVPRDALGQAMSVSAFAELLGAPLEEMSEVVPGEVMAELGQLSGRQDMSAIDARAIVDVDAIVLQPEALRALLIAEAELGERILRALILRRVALIEIGFGGPVLIGPVKSPDMTRLSSFLERNSVPVRVVDSATDPDATALLARFAADPGELPIAVLPDGTVLRNPTKQELARAVVVAAAALCRHPDNPTLVDVDAAELPTVV